MIVCNQKDLILYLSREFGFPKQYADEVIKVFLGKIASELKKGNKIKIRNFGVFEMRKSHSKLRPKFNPARNLFKFY